VTTALASTAVDLARIQFATTTLGVAFVFAHRSAIGFAPTAVGVVLTVATLFTSLYPRVMVSSPGFGNSLTVQNAASAHYTLAVMTVVALVGTPVVLLYQGWTYHVFGRRLGEPEVEAPAQPAGS
jgi:cytochrome bd ubiquinol oxidase subunit II